MVKLAIAIFLLLNGALGCLVSWMSIRDRIRLNRQTRNTGQPAKGYDAPVALVVGSIMALCAGAFLVW